MTTLAAGQFEQIADIAMQQWGLNLTEKKRQLVSNRLSKFLRKSPFENVAEYLEHLQNDSKPSL